VTRSAESFRVLQDVEGFSSKKRPTSTAGIRNGGDKKLIRRMGNFRILVARKIRKVRKKKDPLGPAAIFQIVILTPGRSRKIFRRHQNR